MTDLRRRFVEQIRRDGASLTPRLAAAFAEVPREAFVPTGFQRRDGRWAEPGTPGFLEAVYRDDVLVTKLEDGVPVSSSSQPSLMAIMLNALEVAPGDRVLEIGAGTGYNAALLAHLGAEVTTIDSQPDVAERAAAALGSTGPRVLVADGYTALPGEEFDKMIVTVGVAGLSPHWLAVKGPIVAPVEHAGTHPVLAVSRSEARVLCPSGFMSASGPLTARHPGSHPHPLNSGAVTALAEAAPARWKRPLDSLTYRDLWYAAGVWSRRATHAALPGREQSCLFLLDEAGTGGAAILPDGAILAGGAEAATYAAEAEGIIDRWEAAAHPPMQAWTITLEPTADPDSPIWVPARWTLD